MLAIFSVLAASSLCAQTIRPNPDPGITGEGYVDYVGHFGEVFKLRGGGTIDAFMSGGTEVINLYPKFQQGLPDGVLKPFRPKASDFKPENFTRLELIQLLIIPRSSGGFKSLEELKKAKIQDLEASGVRYRVFDQPIFPSFHRDWPAGTFAINILAPYQLSQLYTATTAHLCILTAGLDTPPSTEIGNHSGALRSALANWVVPEEEPVLDESPSAIIAEGLTFSVLPVVWIPWAAITGLACLLVGFLKMTSRWSTLRHVSLAVLIFTNSGILLGGLVGLICWPFAWFTHHLPIPGGIACLLMPLLAVLVSRVSRVAARRRTLIGMSLWALASAAVIGYYGSSDWGSGSRYVVVYNAVVGFVFYTIGGVIFGLLDAPKVQTPGKKALLTLFVLLAASSARSQEAGQDADAKARASLAKQGITEATYTNQAKVNLGKTQVLYNLQRVEIKGILARNSADNDTNSSLGPMFDLQIAPTHLGTRPENRPTWMQPSNVVADFRQLSKDAHNQLSSAAEEAVKQLEGKEVSEIVAHSWGTEIVYNAILAGKILAPRRLIVAGMPDRDLEKWKALSKFTGTEVVVYPDSSDPAAGAARILGGAIERAEIAGQMAENSIRYGHQDVDRPDPVKLFEHQWTNACAQREKDNVCNRHQRKAPEPVFRDDYQGGTHNRLEYYQAMQDRGDLPMPPPEQQPFPHSKPPYPGSAKALAAEQDALINKEKHRLFEAAVVRERLFAASAANTAPEAVKGQADMGVLDAWGKGAAVVAEKTRAAQAIQTAEASARKAREEELAEINRAVLAARPREATADELSDEAARCGYAFRIEDHAGRRYMGFKDGHSYFGGLTSPGPLLEFHDAKVMFLIARACDPIVYPQFNSENAPGICNDSAPALRERVTRPEFHAQINLMFNLPSGKKRFTDNYKGPCVQEILANADNIVDSASFMRVMSAYKKRVEKNEAAANKSYDESVRKAEARRKEHERAERAHERQLREDARDNRTPPDSPDHDKVWKKVNPIIGR